MTLADFLLARIAEDEEQVRQAREMRADEAEWSDVEPQSDATFHAHHDGALWHPAMTVGVDRAQDECEAKRRIVEMHQQNRDRIDANASEHRQASTRSDLSALPALRSAGWDLGGRDWALEMTLRLLALPYADHPDYDPLWKP